MSDTRSGKSFGGEVDHRAQQLLKLLVEHHISDGTPVASKALAMLPQVQPLTTVRNVMGDLEALGLVSCLIRRRARCLPSWVCVFSLTRC